MGHYTRAPAVSSLEPAPLSERGQRSIVLALLATVVLLDQATKWWAWRHMSGALINSGGAPLVDPVVGGWWTDAVTGRLLDLLGVGFLSTAVLLLVRRRRSLAVVASAALVIGGWGSNLLDRLGAHSLTAPGSTRGAVDFLPIFHYRFNLADVVIFGATGMLVLSAGLVRRRGRRRAPEARDRVDRSPGAREARHDDGPVRAGWFVPVRRRFRLLRMSTADT